eukprot:COSAG03_NODE_152_length_11474_cov_37.043077_4_plen_542_part_00
MFKQSIDPRGAFPPKSSKKPVKKPKKAPIKRRKKTRDRFGAERQAEQVFKFGERRSGLSGRQIFRPPQQQQSNFSPGDFIRIHQQAIKNQIRDETEKKATGGTFTGTSIGEEKRVREQQQADREFRRQEADNRRRFVGAIERFVDKATTPKPEPKPDKEVLGALKDIKEEIKKAKIPVINLRDKPRGRVAPQRERESVGIADIEEISSIGTPIPEHRQPEDDISFLSLDRSSRSHKTIPSSDRPRPTPNNPSKSKAIPSQEKIDTSSFLADLERRSRQPEIELSQEEQEEIRHKIYDSLVGGLQRPAKQKELGYREPRPQAEQQVEPEPEFKLEEDITPEARKRRSQFLEEGGDTTEFLTPTGDISPIKEQKTISVSQSKKPTETPIIAPPLISGTEQVGSEAPQREPISDATRIQARLENYKALARFSENQKSIPKNFDNQKLHYRLQVLEDISAEELGRQKRVGGFSKGEQFRLQRTDYKEQKIANRGFYFYRNNKGKQQAPKQENLFKINLANPKVDGLFQEAIKQGKIKIVYDEFDD